MAGTKRRKTTKSTTTSKKRKITQKPTTLVTLPKELSNNIFEMIVVHRDPRTGEQRPVQMRSFIIVVRHYLRAAMTCKKFYEIMVPMFYGINVFDIEQRGRHSTRPDHYNLHETFAKGTGLELFRTAITLVPLLSPHMLQHTFLLPPFSAWYMLKNLNVRLEIPRHVVRGVPFPAQKEELISKNPSWLFILDELSGRKSLDLEVLKISITVESGAARAYDSTPESAENRRLAREVLKEFLEVEVPKIAAKKVVIMFPDEWMVEQ